MDEMQPCARCKKQYRKKELFLVEQPDGKKWMCYACWNMVA